MPPNLRFEVDDAESDWTYSFPFDFIHLRTLGGSIRDVPRLLRQAYDNLNPGGWIEWQEYEMTLKTYDNSFPENSALVKWVDNVNLAAEKFGKEMNIAPALKSAMEEAGFVRAVDQVYKVRQAIFSGPCSVDVPMMMSRLSSVLWPLDICLPYC